MRRLVITATLALLATGAQAEDTWSITTPEGEVFTQESQRAMNRYASADLWEFSAWQFQVRLAPDFPDGANETSEFGRNNTLFTLPLTVEGQKVRLSCRPDEDAPGTATRTELTDRRISGSFTMTVATCRDYATDAPVAYEGLPFTLTGEFSVDLK